MRRVAPRHVTPGTLGVVALALAACTGTSPGTAGPGSTDSPGSTGSTVEAALAETTSGGPVVDLVGEMNLDPPTGPAGTEVHVRGAALPPSSSFDLVWSGNSGSWDVRGDMNEEFHGRVFTPTTEVLTAVSTDADGSLEASFVAPEGFGFGHDVTLVDEDGVVRNRALFNVEMAVRVSPTEGPVGTPITIEIEGMGVDNLENNRQILYDNRYVGWVSAITTNGRAVATITATGGVGEHDLVIARGAFTFPYLNPQQSPRPDIPVFREVFTVTEGEPVLPPAIPAQADAPGSRPSEEHPTGVPWMTTDLISGPVGTPLTITGGGFDPAKPVAISWYRIVGNRVSGAGWDEQSLDLGEVTAGDDGSFVLEIAVPTDVGGPHRIEALSGDETLATTSFAVSVAAEPLIGETVTAGETVTIDLSGVGWTETANIYTVVYDNAYIGYACGFNTQGDVTVELTATGEPGWHFVDLYPAIYKGEEKGVQSFRIPQLTYADDHPGEDLPAFHYAFYVNG